MKLSLTALLPVLALVGCRSSFDPAAVAVVAACAVGPELGTISAAADMDVDLVAKLDTVGEMASAVCQRLEEGHDASTALAAFDEALGVAQVSLDVWTGDPDKKTILTLVLAGGRAVLKTLRAQASGPESVGGGLTELEAKGLEFLAR